MKKIFLIIGIIVLLGIASFLIFGGLGENGQNIPNFSMRDFLPFGDSGDNNFTDSGENKNEKPENIFDPDAKIPKLRKLSKEPVAGAVIFGSGTSTLVRFVEKGTGNVYEASSEDLIIKRLTNTTIPKIVRAFWLRDGSGFLAQTLEPETELIETSFVKLNKNTATSTNETLTPFATTISKLPTGIKEISISPDGKKIVYYTVSSVSNWFLANPDGTSVTNLFNHPLTEWLPKWIDNNNINIQTKSGGRTIGFNYIFDLKTKNLKKVGPGLIGISTNPDPEGNYLISAGSAIPSIFVYENKNGTLSSVNIQTLAEKCAWSIKEKLFAYCAIPNRFENGVYPDSWYQGLIETEDFIEKVDLKQNLFYRVASLSFLNEAEEKIDVIDPQISRDDAHLLFRNKKDGYLWLLRIVD